MSIPNTYLVCGAPHCGGSRLCEALRESGVAGVPRAYFRPAPPGSEAHGSEFAGFEASAWARQRGIGDFPAFLSAIRKEGGSANGVFGASLHWSDFGPLMEKIRVFTPYGGNATIRQLLRRSFGETRFVYLVRRDRVAQAVDWALHRETSPVAGRPEPRFDPERIDALRLQIQETEAGWESLFDVLDAEPLRLHQEDWGDDLAATLREILRWLGIPDAPAPIDPQRLTPPPEAAPLAQAWAARYRALRELADEDALGGVG